MDKATGLAAELLDKHHPDIDEVALSPGAKGVFDVTFDGKLVFSKHTSGRFPTYDEVAAAFDA